MKNTMEQQAVIDKSEDTAYDIEHIKNFIFVSLISSDNHELSEEIKQKIIDRRMEQPDNWEYILEPMGDSAKKYIKLMTA